MAVDLSNAKTHIFIDLTFINLSPRAQPFNYPKERRDFKKLVILAAHKSPYGIH